MRKIFLIIIILFLFTGCGKDILLDFEKHQRGENPYDPMMPEVPSDETDGNWVFMIYLDAANNLGPAGVSDLQELVQGSSGISTNDLRIFVLMDRIDGYSTADGDWKNTKLFEIKNGTNTLISNYSDLDMGDPTTLENFIKYCMSKYNTYNYYLLDLWNHGGGWRDNPQTAEYTPRKAICWDDESAGSTLYMNEVQQAISSALSSIPGKSKLDVIYMDACLMQMIEVGYELKELTKYLVASEETVPGDGGDYTDILERYKKLISNNTRTPYMVSYEIVSSYRAQYYATSGTTLSALDLTRIGTLVSAINVFAESLTKQSGGTIKDIRADTRDFTYTDQADLYHFAKLCNERISGGVAGAQSVMDAIDDMVVKEYHHGSSMEGSYGMAIYLPRSPSEVTSEYTSNTHSIDFIANTKWNDFIKWYSTQ